MRCPACGTELPDVANYCFHCGARQQAVASPAASEYEHCDLRFVNRLYGVYYEARQGHAVIARSADGLSTRREANENLVARLRAQGWEPDPEGAEERGYVVRLRRPLAAGAARAAT
jgi:hypothetical protein